jgi:hypothetical protein
MLSLSRRRLVSCITQCRSFSSSPRPSFPAQGEAERKEKTDGDWSAPKDPTLAVWRQTAGKQFEKPHRPCNWLGGKVVEFVPVCVLGDLVAHLAVQPFR